MGHIVSLPSGSRCAGLLCSCLRAGSSNAYFCKRLVQQSACCVCSFYRAELVCSRGTQRSHTTYSQQRWHKVRMRGRKPVILVQEVERSIEAKIELHVYICTHMRVYVCPCSHCGPMRILAFRCNARKFKLSVTRCDIDYFIGTCQYTGKYTYVYICPSPDLCT